MRTTRVRLSVVASFLAFLAATTLPALAAQNIGHGSGLSETQGSHCGCIAGTGTCTQSQVGAGALYCTKEKGDTCSTSCGFMTSTSKFAPEPATHN